MWPSTLMMLWQNLAVYRAMFLMIDLDVPVWHYNHEYWTICWNVPWALVCVNSICIDYRSDYDVSLVRTFWHHARPCRVQMWKHVVIQLTTHVQRHSDAYDFLRRTKCMLGMSWKTNKHTNYGNLPQCVTQTHMIINGSYTRILFSSKKTRMLIISAIGTIMRQKNAVNTLCGRRCDICILISAFDRATHTNSSSRKRKKPVTEHEFFSASCVFRHVNNSDKCIRH